MSTAASRTAPARYDDDALVCFLQLRCTTRGCSWLHRGPVLDLGKALAACDEHRADARHNVLAYGRADLFAVHPDALKKMAPTA